MNTHLNGRSKMGFSKLFYNFCFTIKLHRNINTKHKDYYDLHKLRNHYKLKII